jgi:hypothetical protein
MTSTTTLLICADGHKVLRLCFSASASVLSGRVRKNLCMHGIHLRGHMPQLLASMRSSLGTSAGLVEERSELWITLTCEERCSVLLGTLVRLSTASWTFFAAAVSGTRLGLGSCAGSCHSQCFAALYIDSNTSAAA